MNKKKNAVVLWTGGKDSFLALHLSRKKNLNVIALVTFVPPGNAEFTAHPQYRIRNQAKRMEIDIHFIEIVQPYKLSYIKALKWIKKCLKSSVIITGDIDLIDGLPNWIEQCCEGLSIEIYRPLWHKSREWIMAEMLIHEIQAEITMLNHPLLPREWLNRIIDVRLLQEMKILCDSAGIDLAGENGEYHTMVVAGPGII